MKLLRSLLFIPICFIVISLIYFLVGRLLSWVFSLSPIWIIITIFFLGTFIWGVFRIISVSIMNLASKISPSYKFAFWTITIFSVFNGLIEIFNAWMLDVNYEGRTLLITIVYTILMISITLSLIIGTSAIKEDYL